MNRRSLLLAALALVAARHEPRAQAPARVYRLGFLGGSSPTSPEARHIWQAFLDALKELGYIEGRNLVIEGRYYGDHLDQVPAFADELVRLRVDVIVAAAQPAPEAARRATSTIPIVMANHSDPIGSGLAASLAKPGGNVTGLSLVASELRIKQLQLLRDILPGLTRVAFLRIPTVPLDTTELVAQARALGLQVRIVEARRPEDFAGAFAVATADRAGALMVLGGSMFFAHREALTAQAARSRIPTVYLLREFVEAGGLLAYGVDIRDSFRRAAGYVDKILKGARPGDLPIEQPTKFDLAVNLKAAKALGLTIPPSVLARADMIVE